jgi:hypothetical protein
VANLFDLVLEDVSRTIISKYNIIWKLLVLFSRTKLIKKIKNS